MKAVLVANGNLNEKLLGQIKPHDFLVGVDAGTLFLLNHNFSCDLAVGDFDSVSPREFELIKKKAKDIVCFNPDKDFTDTELAIREVKKRGYKNILILGAVGSRLDHTIANILLLDEGIKIVDEYNEIEMIKSKKVIEPACRQAGSQKFKYVSFVSITDFSTLSLSGFKYPLKNKKIKRGQTLCLSNEMKNKKALIEVSYGKILMIKSRD